MYTIVHNRDSTMKQVTFTEFRRNAAALFNSVERGETVRIIRHGKPIAEIVPLPAPRVALAWKRPGPELTPDVRNASLSREILRERRGSMKGSRS